jgi:formylglycine-generating enzyme required for sulfatase activity
VPGGHIFISYASEDAAVAERIRVGFEQSGVACWIAPRDIEPGTSFPAAITAAIRSSNALVLLLTSQSNQSRHVLSEVELAFNAGKPILAVLVGRLTPSPDLQYFIATTHWFDAESSFDDADMAKLHADLAKLLAGERLRLTRSEADGRRRRMQLIAAAAALVLVIAAVIYVLLWRSGATPAPQSSIPPTGNVNPTDVPTPAPSPTTNPLVDEINAKSKDVAAVVAASEVSSARSATPLRTKVNAADDQTYVWVLPGRFVMGCSPGDPDCQADEHPQHAVRVEGFWMARTEVTAAQYARRAGSGAAAAGDANLPATGVTWAEAKAYCGAIGGRLPTETEWEFAARGGTSERYYATLSDSVWYEANSDDRPRRVGQKAPNAFGLHDMLGNVYEWVLDRYYNQYDDTSVTVEEPLAGNASATARGGAWHSDAKDVRVSNRYGVPKDYADANVGFRCALNGP